jgi:hypothetical protein
VTPELGVVVGAIVTLAGLFYRHLLKQLEDERAEKVFWRDRALEGVGLAEIATEQAEAPSRRKP